MAIVGTYLDPKVVFPIVWTECKLMVSETQELERSEITMVGPLAERKVNTE